MRLSPCKPVPGGEWGWPATACPGCHTFWSLRCALKQAGVMSEPQHHPDPAAGVRPRERHRVHRHAAQALRGQLPRRFQRRRWVSGRGRCCCMLRRQRRLVSPAPSSSCQAGSLPGHPSTQPAACWPAPANRSASAAGPEGRHQQLAGVFCLQKPHRLGRRHPCVRVGRRHLFRGGRCHHHVSGARRSRRSWGCHARRRPQEGGRPEPAPCARVPYSPMLLLLPPAAT